MHFKHCLAFGLFSLLLVAGCGRTPYTTNTVTTSTLPAQNENESLGRNAELAGTAGQSTIRMSLFLGNGLVGTYTLGKNKPMEVSGMVDENDPSTYLFSDFNELDERPNIFTFEMKEKYPRQFEGSMKNKETGVVVPLAVDEVDNDMAEQKQFGGHYVRGTSAYVDILFIDSTHIALQALAAWPELASKKNPSPNIWPYFNTQTFTMRGATGESVSDNECGLHLIFTNNALTVTGPSSGIACGAGGNTSFDGVFVRTTTTIPNWNIAHSNQ